MKFLFILPIIVLYLFSCNNNEDNFDQILSELEQSSYANPKKQNNDNLYIFKGGHEMRKSEWLTTDVINYSAAAYGGEENARNILDCYMTKVAKENYYEDIKILFEEAISEADVIEAQAVFDKYNLQAILLDCVEEYQPSGGNIQAAIDTRHDNGHEKEYMILHLRKEFEKDPEWNEVKKNIHDDVFLDCLASKIIETQGSSDIQKTNDNYFESSEYEEHILICTLESLK